MLSKHNRSLFVTDVAGTSGQAGWQAPLLQGVFLGGAGGDFATSTRCLHPGGGEKMSVAPEHGGFCHHSLNLIFLWL